jgi:hypothetical protein
MAVNDTILLSVRGTLQGQQYIHTQHFRQINVPAPGVDPLQTLINDWQGSPGTYWLSAHKSNYTLVDIKAEYVCGSLPLPAAVVEAVGTAGTRVAGGPALAPWLSAVVSERTAFAGKSYRGRFFVSGGGEEDVAEQIILTGAASWGEAINAYISNLMALFGPAGVSPAYRLVVYSPTIAARVPAPDCTVSAAYVVSMALNPALSTQKSRRG